MQLHYWGEMLFTHSTDGLTKRTTITQFWSSHTVTDGRLSARSLCTVGGALIVSRVQDALLAGGHAAHILLGCTWTDLHLPIWGVRMCLHAIRHYTCESRLSHFLHLVTSCYEPLYPQLTISVCFVLRIFNGMGCFKYGVITEVLLFLVPWHGCNVCTVSATTWLRE